jgi:hypothetical protein
VTAQEEERQAKQRAADNGELILNGNVYETAHSSSLASHLVSPLRGRRSKSNVVPVVEEGYFGMKRPRSDAPAMGSAVDSIFGSSTASSSSSDTSVPETVQLADGRTLKLLSHQNSQYTHLKRAGGEQGDVDVMREVHTLKSGQTTQITEVAVDRQKGMRRESVIRTIGERSKSIIHTRSESDGRWMTEKLMRNLDDERSSAQFDSDWDRSSATLHSPTNLPAGSPKAAIARTTVTESLRSPTERTTKTHSQQQAFTFDAAAPLPDSVAAASPPPASSPRGSPRSRARPAGSPKASPKASPKTSSLGGRKQAAAKKT